MSRQNLIKNLLDKITFFMSYLQQVELRNWPIFVLVLLLWSFPGAVLFIFVYFGHSKLQSRNIISWFNFSAVLDYSKLVISGQWARNTWHYKLRDVHLAHGKLRLWRSFTIRYASTEMHYMAVGTDLLVPSLTPVKKPGCHLQLLYPSS